MRLRRHTPSAALRAGLAAFLTFLLSPSALAGGGTGPGTPPTVHLGELPVHATTQTLGRSTDTGVRTPSGVYAVIGHETLLTWADLPAEPELRHVTVTDLFNTPQCDELACELLGWQQRDLPAEAFDFQQLRAVLRLEDAQQSETAAGRTRFAGRQWNTEYLVTLHFWDKHSQTERPFSLLVTPPAALP